MSLTKPCPVAEDESFYVAKHDFDKPRMDLVPMDVIEEIAKVFTFGCTPKEKGGAGYGENSWKDVPNAKKRYRAAQLRHEAALEKGHLHDDESGLLTEAHIAWNAIARLWLRMHNKGD